MYAHQVIENIMDESNHLIGVSDDKYKKECEFIIKYIQRAIKFNFGNMQTNVKLVCGNGDLKETLEFLKWGNRYFKLPFHLCWFDWAWPFDESFRENLNKSSVTKRGALLINKNNYINIYHASFWHKFKKWSIDPILISYHAESATFDYYKLFHESSLLGAPNHFNINDKVIEQDASLTIGYLMICLTLLNCKNIYKEKIEAPTKLNKKRAKHFKPPLFDYYILKVKFPGNGSKKKSNDIKNINRLHLCRGHFKEYTQKNPLFGKYTGLYWWQPHIRGNKKRGIIMKDYSIKC